MQPSPTCTSKVSRKSFRKCEACVDQTQSVQSLLWSAKEWKDRCLRRECATVTLLKRANKSSNSVTTSPISSSGCLRSCKSPWKRKMKLSGLQLLTSKDASLTTSISRWLRIEREATLTSKSTQKRMWTDSLSETHTDWVNKINETLTLNSDYLFFNINLIMLNLTQSIDSHSSISFINHFCVLLSPCILLVCFEPPKFEFTIISNWTDQFRITRTKLYRIDVWFVSQSNSSEQFGSDCLCLQDIRNLCSSWINIAGCLVILCML